ncbi:hypothetical protein [Mucilaginibacter sp. R-33]|uniref:hypothetical protein n=1 Tax=unclassified Mucilaginibacter TaxID=2617802 RepID=UPI003CED695D
MKKTKIQKPFIHYEELKYWEQVTIVIYTALTLVIVFSPFILGVSARQNSIVAYAISTQLFFYGFLYVSLRNFRSYLIWLCFGIIHFIVFLWFRYDVELGIGMANPSGALANTFPLLLLFQLLRMFSIKAQKREFGVPSKGARTDWIEGEKITGIDFLIFVIYMGIWFLLTVFSLKY